MKFLKGWALTVFACACFVLAYFLAPSKSHDISPERKAAHLILFITMDEAGNTKPKGFCSATAVGPQVLLTATHCMEGQGPLIRIDLSPTVYKIDGGIEDGRDHAVIHIQDVLFKNTVTVRQRPAVMGERVRMYGNGGDDYPAHARYGKVIADSYEGDLSDLDRSLDVASFSLQVEEGDSGSAIYADDGSIVGLASYGRGEPKANHFEFCTGFGLNFDPQVLELIKK